MAERHADARQQLIDAEGFGQVIVGTEIERSHLVVFAVADREHNDRHVGPLTYAPEDLQPIDLGHPQVEQEHIRMPGCHLLQCGSTILGECYLVAMHFQRGLQKAPNLRLIVDDEYAWLHPHSSRARPLSSSLI